MKKNKFLLSIFSLLLIFTFSLNALILDDVTIDENANISSEKNPDKVTIKFHNYPDDITGNLKMLVNNVQLDDNEYNLVNERIKSYFYILIDNSGSMKTKDLEAIKTNVLYFLSRVNPKDEVQIDLISNYLSTLYELAPYKMSINPKIKAIRQEGNYSHLYDALYELNRNVNVQKAKNPNNLYYIILFSDGEDTLSDITPKQLVKFYKDIPLYYFCYSSDYKERPNKPIVELTKQNGKFYNYLDTNMIDSLFFSNENRYTLDFYISKKHVVASNSYLIELSKKTTDDGKIIIDLRKYFDAQNGNYSNMIIDAPIDINIYNNLKGNLRHDTQLDVSLLPQSNSRYDNKSNDNSDNNNSNINLNNNENNVENNNNNLTENNDSSKQQTNNNTQNNEQKQSNIGEKTQNNNKNGIIPTTESNNQSNIEKTNSNNQTQNGSKDNDKNENKTYNSDNGSNVQTKNNKNSQNLTNNVNNNSNIGKTEQNTDSNSNIDNDLNQNNNQDSNILPIANNSDNTVDNNNNEQNQQNFAQNNKNDKKSKESNFNWRLLLLILLILILLLLLILFIIWLIRKIADSQQPVVSGGRSSGGIERTPVETYTPPTPVVSNSSNSSKQTQKTKTTNVKVKYRISKDLKTKQSKAQLKQNGKATYVDQAERTGETVKIGSNITIIEILDDYIVGASTAMFLIDDNVKIKDNDFTIRRARYSNKKYTYEIIPVNPDYDIKSNIKLSDNVVTIEKTVSVYGDKESIINKMLVPANIQIVSPTWFDGTLDNKNQNKTLTANQPLYLDVVIEVQEGSKTNQYMITDLKYDNKKYIANLKQI